MNRVFLYLFLFLSFAARAQEPPVDPHMLDSLTRSMERQQERVAGRQDSLAKRLDSVQRKQQLVVAEKAGLNSRPSKTGRTLVYVLIALGLFLLATVILRSRRKIS